MALVPTLPVCVWFRREPVPGPMARWQPWRWVLDKVEPVADFSQGLDLKREDRCVQTGADGALWEYRGLEVGLFRDDAEGLHLNATTEQPCFWVMWRLHEHEGENEPRPVPLEVTLSYHDAGRWLDAQEQVDRFDAPQDVVDWLRDFTREHYRPEPKRRQRPQSFQPLTDRFGQPASVSAGPKGRNRGGPQDGQ